jgi:microcystin degradation protein MlrC
VTSARRIGIVAVYHETNTFSSRATTLAAFRGRWHEGAPALIEAFAGTRTVIGGMLESDLVRRSGVVAGFGCFATPSGPVDSDAFETILGAVRAELERHAPLDGILLELHGSMSVRGVPDAEQAVIDVIRESTPASIVAVLDLHTNASRSRFGGVDAAIGYRTNPHVDTAETGERAAGLLDLRMGDPGSAWTREHAGLALAVPPIAQRTDDEPLRELLAEATRLESEHGLLDVTIHAGYAYQDVPHLGMGFTATAPADRRDAATAAVATLRELAVRRSPGFARELDRVDRVISTLRDESRRFAVADTGDNINAGAAGDTTWLARAFLDSGSRRPAITTIADAREFDRIAARWNAGETAIYLELGGLSSPRAGGPLRGAARIAAVTDGGFRNSGPMRHGLEVSMGGAALVSLGPLDIVVQREPVQPNDPELFRSVGIDLDRVEIAFLKGAAALRAAWEPLGFVFLDADTDGDTPSSLDRLGYSPPPVG